MPERSVDTPQSTAASTFAVLRLALYQPDIPQNTGTMLRMAACLGIGADIIEPAGFPVSDRAFRRAGMDYLDLVAIERHISWEAFAGQAQAAGNRIVLLSTKATQSHIEFGFQPGDILVVGRESAGVPQAVYESVDATIRIPMLQTLRSLNVAVAAALVCGEALRQLGSWPVGSTNIED